MPTRFLSDAERGAFSSWPDVARSDLVAYFSLDPDDIRWVRSLRYPANQIASAVQLAALPYLGFVPDPLNAPVAVVEYVSERIGVPAGALGGYTTTSDRVRQQHTTAVIERLGWSLCGRGEWKLLGDWLVARALEHDALSVLFRQALTHLRAERVVRPGLDRLMRAVASARVTASDEMYRMLRPVLAAVVLERLDALIETSPETGVAKLVELNEGASSASPSGDQDRSRQTAVPSTGRRPPSRPVDDRI